MRSLSLLLLFAATLAAALPAAAQTTPRRPPADTVRFGTTRPAAGDSIAMAEYEEEDEDAAGEESDASEAAAGEEAAEDTVPVKPRSGPYTRAGGSGGPFSVQASGQAAARPPRGDVVWLQGRAARPAASDSARRDTARAGTGQRVASGTATRRDTASSAANRPTRRDTASSATNRPARRDTAATAANRPARRDSATASRPAARDTAGARRNGQSTSTTTGGRAGSTSTTTSGRTGSTSTTSSSTSTNGRTGSTSTTTSGSTSGRARTHTVAAGETFFGIARRYGVTAAQLRAINPDVEQDALEIGDVLRLPAAARDSRAGSTPAAGSQRTGGQTTTRTGSQSGSAQRRTHTVAAGETLFGIARRYGVTVAAIRTANDLDEDDGLRTGQRLVIPPAR
jgi:membrane-bound lytic murein transglycosylase D